MFGTRDLDSGSRRFWAWFGAEAHGIANAFEALARGEADTEGALERLNLRIRRIDPTLEADIVRTLDGQCHMTITGPEAAVTRLLALAPRLAGWRFTPHAVLADPRRIPFRLAPRPSLDLLGTPLTARHEAYA